MQRKMRVPNPYYRAIPVEWKLMVDEKSPMNGSRDGRLEIMFRTSDEKGNTTVLAFPCFVSDHRCFPQKVGTMRKMTPEGYCVEREEFSVVEKYEQGGKSRSYVLALNDVVERVARAIEIVLSSVSGHGRVHEATHLVTPKTMRIPRKVTVCEVSHEQLQEEGLLGITGIDFQEEGCVVAAGTV